jgi:hypothetical protein
MSLCPICGAKIEGVGNFCANCGASASSQRISLQAPSQRPQTQKVNNRWIAEVAIFLAFVTALITALIVAGIISNKKQPLRETEASEYAAKAEREKKAAEEAKAAEAAEEKAQFERLSPEVQARIAFAKVISAAYENENAFIGVRATGENFDILELSSSFIRKDSSTLEHAKEIFDPDLVKNIEHLKFKKVIIKNPDSGYSESYAVK